MKNKVSIWIGKFNSKEELLKYSEEIYPDGSDEPVCAFWEDFNIDYIDHDNLEKGFKEKVMSF